ncbi:MAG: hypothetical protein P4L77_12495 [Sulfuriferula sp.]|nr:hypothetical protein [Sulfuriferula sp.]
MILVFKDSIPLCSRMRYGRLVWTLLLALVVHILVFAVLRGHSPAILVSFPVTALTVQLPPVISQQKSFEAHELHKTIGASTAYPEPLRKVSQIQFSRQVAHTNLPDKESVPAVAALPVVPASPSSSVTVDGLLDSAKHIVRDEAHRMHTGKDEVIDFETRSMLPALAQAMQNKTAGETRFVDGLIKVVTPMGTVYCLKVPSDVTGQSGLVEPVAVPTTCP